MEADGSDSRAPGRGGVGRAEHALELRLLGAEVRAVARGDAVAQLEAVEDDVV